MTHFIYQDGILFAEQVPLSTIADQYGTPCYVYSRAAIEQHFLDYQNNLAPHKHLICYSVKANSNLAVLNILARLGAGFDIVSGGELERVIAAGGDPAKIIFSGVAKTHEEMEHALLAGIHCFNVESVGELERLNEVASDLNRQANISIRVNPDVDAQTHPYISTGLRENKFGIDINIAEQIYVQAQALAAINIVGIDSHIGSQLTDVAPFLEAVDRILLLIDRLETRGIKLEHIDVGGGLGVRYRNETPPHPEELVSALLHRLQGRSLTLIVEPGRSIVANAGVLLTRVEYLKMTAARNFAIVDAAMNDMIRPALYGAWLSIDPVQPNTDQQPLAYDIVGPICETADFLGKDRVLAIVPGDLLAIGSSGAYGFSMSSNYNSRGRAAEIMVDRDNYHLIRERETIADLIRGETVLP